MSFRITLGGKQYTVHRVTQDKLPKDADAICSPPEADEPFIAILRTLQGRKLLDRCVHECLHGAFWVLDEDAVDKAGMSIADMIWKMGYRKVEKECKC